MENESKNKNTNNNDPKTNYEGVMNFIKENMENQDTKTINALKKKSNKIVKNEYLQLTHTQKLNSIENFIDNSANILNFCRKNCDPFKFPDYRECSRNCVVKYLEQLKLIQDKNQFFKNELYMDDLIFNFDENKEGIKKVKSLENKTEI